MAKELSEQDKILITRIEEYRIKRGLTKKALADLLNLPQSTISEWQSGRQSPITHISKVADVLQVDVNYLLGRTDTPTTAYIPDNLTLYTSDEMVVFPVIGTITAGYDGLGEYNPTGEDIPVPQYLLKSHNKDDYFVLEVKGNSMKPVYNEGDKVLIRKCSSVDSGKVAAIGYDGEDATLKKVEYVQGENWMKLIPLNPEYPTKTIYNGDLELCHVYGEVVYTFSNKTQYKAEILNLGGNNAETLKLMKKIDTLSAEQKQLIISMINNMSPNK